MDPFEQMQNKMKTYFEIRNEFHNKYQRLLCDPEATDHDRKMGKAFCNLFSDIEAVAKCPRDTLCIGMLWLGHTYKEITAKGGLYDQVYADATRKFILIDPDLSEELKKLNDENHGAGKE